MEARASWHSRSISLPSTCHPLDASIEDHLSRLRIASASSSSSICRNLVDIKDLYERINELILLPINHQIFSRHHVRCSTTEELLEGSLALLDVCDTIIDVLCQMKESVLELESSLRRRSGDASCLSAYKASRRKIVKLVSKCLGSLKKVELTRQEKDDERVVFVVRILRESQIICLSIFKSVLSFMFGSKAQKGWSLVSMLILQPKLGDENEVEKVDRALFGLDAKKMNTDVKSVQTLQKKLGELEMIINGIEDRVVSFSGCLVKTRVSLLNLLNH